MESYPFFQIAAQLIEEHLYICFLRPLSFFRENSQLIFSKKRPNLLCDGSHKTDG